MIPRVARLTAHTVAVYTVLTALLGVALRLAGMNGFAAVLHAMTSISCGGFSTADGSIGSWHKPAIEWTVLVGMVIGGGPFVIYLQIVRGRWRTALRNSQWRSYLALLLGAAIAMTAWLIIAGGDAKPWRAFRLGLFTAASVMTGTGFAVRDWTGWGGLPRTLLFFLAFIGGCAGSTSGGIKVFRFQVLYATARVQLIGLLRPRAVLLPHYERKPVPDMVAESVLGFLFVYTLSFALLAMALGMVGLDFLSSLSASAAALGNLGPGLTPAIGPMGSYAAVPDAAKLLLAAAMLFGRLEMFLVLALFAKDFWRD
jgi:trk system potassium uptake protein TrkH